MMVSDFIKIVKKPNWMQILEFQIKDNDSTDSFWFHPVYS